MLNVQVMSDLHLELHRDMGAAFVNSLDPTGVDVLVLAGDILSARFLTQVQERFKQFAAKYPTVLYVPGNHEFWRLSLDEGLSVLSKACAGIPNFHVLNNQVLSLNGRRFLGGPMWFPRWPVTADYAASQMPDFKLIVDFERRVVQENTRFQTFLKENLQAGDVVLTHYMPSTLSVSPRFKGSPLNAFFVCEMDRLMQDRSPALWIHGHTHDSCDYQLSRTRVVCNPFGYPNELNPSYKEKLLIPIE